MRILAVDVGTGTQDILFFDSEEAVENCPQLIMPSPTAIVAQQIRRATARGEAVLLTGVTMGGGPCHWAALEHLRHGLKVYATPQAARTFDDDLALVEKMGVKVVADEEVRGPLQARRIEMGDLYYDQIIGLLKGFGIEDEPDGVAVAVFDHGAAPPGVSDRRFRFEYLAEKVCEANPLAAFAYMRHEIPPHLTRFQAVAQTFRAPQPLLVMDTGPAAVLGALEDEEVGAAKEALIINIGNFHTLAFHLKEGRILGLFEHHTGEITREKLEDLLRKLAQGTLINAEVFEGQGHGALILDNGRRRRGNAAPFVVVAGPQRGLLEGSALKPYRAVPHGDMMLAGCFGLLRAYAAKDPLVKEKVEARLGPPAF